MKINFNLREVQNGIKAAEQKETPINLVIRWKNLKLVRPTGKTVLPSKWNFDKQKAKKSLEHYSTFNSNLHKLESKILEAFETFKIEKQREPNSKEFKEYLIEKIESPSKPKEEMKIPALIELTLVKIDTERKRLLSEGRSTSRTTTIYSYRRLRELLVEFNEASKIGIDYEDITIDWYYEFKDFLNSKNYSINYQGKIIKDFKTIMNLANEKGFTTNKIHKNSKFRKDQVKTYQTYLNEQEIQQLYAFDFSDNIKLCQVRDLFVIACRTGLRISDLKQIKKDQIIKSKIRIKEVEIETEIERNFLRVVTQKTKTEVDIPLHQDVSEILTKYNFKLPSLSDQNFNLYVKEVCSSAGLNELCTFTQSKGKLITRIEKPKYELISSHTGRRSFATNHYKQGFPLISIMAITGHSKVKDFMNYIVLDANEHAKVLAYHYYKLEEEKRAAKQHLKLA